MSVENIIKKINADAENKVREIMKRQKEEARKLTDDIAAESEKRLEEIRKEEEREIKVMTNRIISQAKLDKRKLLLDVRERSIQDVFQEVHDRVYGSSPDKKEDYLRQAIGKASALLEGNITIHCNEKDGDTVKELASKIDPKLNVKDDLSGVFGIKGSSEDGTMLDLTMDANIVRMKKDIRKDIAEILLSGGKLIDR